MSKDLNEVSARLVRLLESNSGDPVSFSKEMVTNLSLLLKSMINLDPKFVNLEFNESGKNNQEEVRINLQKVFEGEKLYKQVFDPIEDDEFVTFSLVNDLCEIYEGLKEYQEKNKLNSDFAAWDFKENFRSHLYQHVLNAMKVLYMEYCKDE